MQADSEFNNPVVPVTRGRKNRKEKVCRVSKRSLKDYIPKFECCHLKKEKAFTRCKASEVTIEDLSCKFVLLKTIMLFHFLIVFEFK